MLRDFHGFKLLKPRFFLDFVIAFVGIVLQMAHIGDVADITDLVAQMSQVSEQDVECDGRARVPEVRVAVNRRPANIHAHVGRMHRLKALLAPG